MLRGTLCKLLQRQTYDVLSQRSGVLAVLLGTLLLLASAFQFGEVLMEWSRDKYAALFHSFSDNVASRSYQARLCLPVPIDVVYTWVNGSDPLLIADLKKFKSTVEVELNKTSSTECSFSHCIPTLKVLVEPRIPEEISQRSIGILYPAFRHSTNIQTIINPTSEKNVSLVEFENKEHVEAALATRMKIRGANVTIKQVYLTSDSTLMYSIPCVDTLMMSGFPHTYTADDLKTKLPKDVMEVTTNLELLGDKGVAVLKIQNKESYDYILKLTNITLDNKQPTISAGRLIWDLHDYSHGEDLSSSRFEDNEELRYSLRSIEMNAPWVRHIFIVTNGQIPYWLNMENPRVSIITHEELFSNSSHLPTFSSPAIESHIHKIPGLSDKFVYMNDDVMFGKEVWPDDFYTHAYGQKVYLTWPVPNCQEGCPTTWIRDGYCDKACNNTECDWDGGDCEGGKTGAQFQFGAAGVAGGAWQIDSTLYCNSGCANNWIADKYCDQACNVKECGFDSGDCGTTDYNKLHGFDLLLNQSHYKIPPGHNLAYFNLTSLVGVKGTPEEGTYNESTMIRSVAISQKFKVLTLVLYENINITTLELSIKAKLHDNTVVQHDFQVVADTRPVPTVASEARVNKTDTTKKEQPVNKTEEQRAVNVTQKPFQFDDIPSHLRFPRPINYKKDMTYPPLNLSDTNLPSQAQQELDILNNRLNQSELTSKGFAKALNILWKRYKDVINKSENLMRNFSQARDMAESKHISSSNAGNGNGNGNGSKIQMKVTKHNELVANNRKTTDIAPPPSSKTFQKFLKRRIHWSDSDTDKEEFMNYIMKDGGNSAKLNQDRQLLEDYTGFLPWEQNRTLSKNLLNISRSQSYDSSTFHSRRLLDTFADSLRHVNRVYNRAFGYVARKVPAHIPHMIDKHVMAEMHTRFPKDWDETSSHKMRSGDDMQFAFSYFYFLMSQPKNISVAEIFHKMDVDESGVLSDREIRTLATRLYDLPLDLQTLNGLENMIINCSLNLSSEYTQLKPNQKTEKYYVTDMPQVTKQLLVNCDAVGDIIYKSFKDQTKYKFEILDDTEVAFKMIRSNISRVVQQLDDIRKTPKKFVCINDNIDHSKVKEANTVKAVLQDFYESNFPKPSQFELSPDYRNRFLHMRDLQEWRRYRDFLKKCTHAVLGCLILFTIYSFFAEKIHAIFMKILPRRVRTGMPQEV